MAEGTPPGWYSDPSRRHEHRYWDGARWTDQIANVVMQRGGRGTLVERAVADRWDELAEKTDIRSVGPQDVARVDDQDARARWTRDGPASRSERSLGPVL
jgi:Protein of unknown function (DUF2510)